MTAASAPTPRSVFGRATTVRPLAWSRVMTPVQLDASAQAPWTRTIVGVSGIWQHPKPCQAAPQRPCSRPSQRCPNREPENIAVRCDSDAFRLRARCRLLARLVDPEDVAPRVDEHEPPSARVVMQGDVDAAPGGQ